MPEQATAGFMATRGRMLPAAAIVAVTLLAYLPAIRGGFFWDDHEFIVGSRLMQAHDGLRRFWLRTEAPDYFPLTSSMFWVEWRLWGAHAAGWHAVNVLLHAASALLLWRVLLRLRVPGPFDHALRQAQGRELRRTAQGRPEGNRMGGAWLASLLFAIHPVAAASAAWITEGKNTLSMTFFLLALLAYLKFEDGLGDWEIGKLGNLETAQSPNFPISQSPLYLLSILFFLLALLAKTSVVMLPVILLLCAWWRRGRICRRDFLRSLPFFALAIALGLVTIWFQRCKAIQGLPVHPEGLASRAAAAGWILWFYLFKLLLPLGLCAIYPRWRVDGPDILAFLPWLLLLGGMVFLWARRKSWGRGPFFAAACFLVSLLPVLGFLDMAFMNYSLAADHFQYPAMVAVLALAGAVFERVGRPARSGRLGAVLCVAVLAVLTWERASLYGDETLLWRDNVAKTPAAWGAWSNLGAACIRADLDREAIHCLDKAIALKPALAEECYYNRGLARSKVKDFRSAVQDYDEAISLNGNSAKTYYNRGWAYAQIHDFNKAIEDYDKAIILYPEYEAAYNNRGAAYERLGRHAEAVRDYSEAIRLMPDNPAPYVNRAMAHYELGEYEAAAADAEKFEKLGGRPDPQFLNALHYAAPRPR